MNPQNIKIKRENFDNYFEKFDNYFERLQKIKVMECNYDKKGYSPIEWTKKMEDNE